MKLSSRIFALSVFGMLTTIAAQPAEPIYIWIVGPVELCESQALMQTFFNPEEYTVSQQVELIDTGSGRIIDSRKITLLPGRGVSLAYQQGRITTDADLNEMPDTCRTTRSVVVVVATENMKAESAAPVRSRVHYVGGRNLSHRVFPQEQSYSRRVVSGLFSTQNASRGTSAPFHVEAGAEITARLMNVGHLGGAVTLEIVDAINGTIIAAKTVYLDPGPDQQTPAVNAFAEFTFQSEAGGRIAYIKRHSPDAGDPASGDPGPTEAPAAIAVSFQIDNNSAHSEVAIQQLTLAHEGIQFD